MRCAQPRVLLCALLAAGSIAVLKPLTETPGVAVATAGEVRPTGADPTAARPRPTGESRPTATATETAASTPSARPAARDRKDRSSVERGPSAAKGTKKTYREYVALGDSWSADVVFADRHGLPDTTHVPIDCAQSHVNYPKLVAKTLGITNFRDATCGSATTDHFANPQADLPLGGSNPPQFDRLTRTTDLVTVGIGGNDAGLAAAAMSCLSLTPVGVPLALPLPDLGLPLVSLTNPPTGACKERFTKGGVDVLAQRIRESEPKLVAAFKRIRQLSPKARILAVNYLAAIPQRGCWPLVPFTDSDVEYLYARFQELNAMVARAAAKGGAELVDTYTPSIGHHVCSPPNHRYVEGLGIVSLNDLAIAVPAHPNAAGARAQAAAVLSSLRR